MSYLGESKPFRPYFTNKISHAAYLMGPCDIELIDAFIVERTGRFRIVLNISRQRAEELLKIWRESESKSFDRKVRFLKGILCCDNPPVKKV